ncbi:MAG: hypothetical protein QF554_14330 [Dehalococcoidia bacterium]|nr:hypothetical protein [Dehalococcoidia bacterium]
MPDKNRHHENEAREPEGSAAEAAGEVGREIAETAADVAGLGTGLLGGLAGALDGLVGGLAGDSSSQRRTRIHPWELPPESGEVEEPDETSGDPARPGDYDEDYDRIH